MHAWTACPAPAGGGATWSCWPRRPPPAAPPAFPPGPPPPRRSWRTAATHTLLCLPRHTPGCFRTPDAIVPPAPPRPPTQVTAHRCNLFCVFLAIPRAAIKQLASRRISGESDDDLDDDLDDGGGDDGDQAPARSGAAAAAAAASPQKPQHQQQQQPAPGSAPGPPALQEQQQQQPKQPQLRSLPSRSSFRRPPGADAGSSAGAAAGGRSGTLPSAGLRASFVDGDGNVVTAERESARLLARFGPGRCRAPHPRLLHGVAAPWDVHVRARLRPPGPRHLARHTSGRP